MAKTTKTPRLSYYPPELETPVMTTAGKEINNTSNVFFQVTMIILMILILAVFVGGLIYVYCFAQENDTVIAIQHKNDNDNQHDDEDENHEPRDKKVTFAVGAQLSEISEEELMALLQSDGSDDLDAVIIAFVSPNCGWCVKMKPALQEAATKSPVAIKTATYDHTSPSPAVTQAMKHLKINGMPMLYRIHKGKATRHNGGRDTESIVQFASGQ